MISALSHKTIPIVKVSFSLGSVGAGTTSCGERRPAEPSSGLVTGPALYAGPVPSVMARKIYYMRCVIYYFSLTKMIYIPNKFVYHGIV